LENTPTVDEVPDQADIDAVEETADAAQADATLAKSRVFDVRDYGAIGDGVADDTVPLVACGAACAAANGTLYVPKHVTIRITAPVDLRYIRNIEWYGRLVIGHTSGYGVRFGSTSIQGGFGLNYFFNDVAYAGVQSNVALQAVGMKNAKTTILSCPYFQMYADAADSTISSVAYNDFWFGKVDKHELYGEAGLSWITRNHFWGGRLTTVIVTGIGYSHNDNIWHGPSLENATVTFNTGNSNHMRDVRGEGTLAVTLAAGTVMNRVVQDWLSNPTTLWTTITKVDNGFDNEVLTEFQEEASVRTVFRIDSASRLTNASSPWITPHATARILPGFRKLKAPASAADVLDTGIFPIEHLTAAATKEGSTKIKRMNFQSDASIWRVKVKVYDANMVALDGSGGQDYIDPVGGWGWSVPNAAYQHGANVGLTTVRIVFNNPTVKFARIILFANSASATFTWANLTVPIQAPYGDEILDRIHRQMERPLSQVGMTVPTHSLLQRGDIIATDTGLLIVTHRVDTTISVAAAAAATTITVASATGIATGDLIAILLDDDTTHFTTVNGAPVGNVVTIAVALPSAAAIGRDVATNRFLPIT
jgi:hypothetical protein